MDSTNQLPPIAITKMPPETELYDVMAGSARWEIPVHDHGLVALLDVMPRLVPVGQTADFAIVQAARVSYGAGTKRLNEDRGLIRYLARHRHTTPFEMIEFKFHHIMPVFVARQWIRHRTACLAEGTEIYFDLADSIHSDGNQLYKLPIEEIAQRFETTVQNQSSEKQQNSFFRRDCVQAMRLRQVNEVNLQIQHTRIVNVYRNGLKPVFRMTLADGKQIEATADHRFFFADGWHSLKEATGLHESGGQAIWDSSTHFVYVNGQVVDVPALYQDKSWLDEQYNKLNRQIVDIAADCRVSYQTIWDSLTHYGLEREPNGSSTEPAEKFGRTNPVSSRANHSANSDAVTHCWTEGVPIIPSHSGCWSPQSVVQVHQRNDWTCQLCQSRSGELYCQPVVPIWADASVAYEESNWTTLCGCCHRRILGRGLEFVEQLGGPSVRTEWRHASRVPVNKLNIAKLVRIERFDYVGLKETYDLEVAGPHHNFIANGIVTHNSVNEYSARYSVVPDRFYRPTEDHLRQQSTTNRQGGELPLDSLTAAEFNRYLDDVEMQYAHYQALLEKGVSRELARIGLPLNIYTEWYWKIDLHNLLHFLSLRLDTHAQKEIRDYAQAMFALIQPIVPLAVEAFLDYQLHAMSLTRLEIEALRNGMPLASENKREVAEWEEKKKRLGLT